MSCSNFWVRLSRSHGGQSEQGRVFPLNPQESQRIPIQVTKEAQAQNLKASEQLRQLLWVLQTRSLRSLSEEGKREVKVGALCGAWGTAQVSNPICGAAIPAVCEARCHLCRALGTAEFGELSWGGSLGRPWAGKPAWGLRMKGGLAKPPCDCERVVSHSCVWGGCRRNGVKHPGG